MAKFVFGLDKGAGGFKILGANVKDLVVSHVAECQAGMVDFASVGMKSKKPVAQLIENGIGRYWVGLGATDMGRVSSRLDYDKLTGSPEVRALLYAALGKAGNIPNVLSGDSQASIAVGVPLGFVTGEKADVTRRVNALRDWMVGKHEWTENRVSRSIDIRNVYIYSQPHAAYLDYVLNDDGSSNDVPTSGEIGVISIGFNTVEFLVMDDGVPSYRFSRSEKVGVRRLLDSVNSAMDGGYDLAELDVKLRASKLDIKRASKTWNELLLGTIERVWGDSHTRFSSVIAVGGGVQFASEALGVFKKNLVKPTDSVFSIAHGLYKVVQSK